MGEVFESIVGTSVVFCEEFGAEMTAREFVGFVLGLNTWPNCTADDVALFLAKQNDKWLDVRDLDYCDLKNCLVPDGTKEIMNDANRMSPDQRLHDFGFPTPEECADIGTLVLMQVPDHIVRDYRKKKIETRRYLYAMAKGDSSLWKRIGRWNSLRKTKKKLGLCPGVYQTRQDA
ncbi:Crinkler (CRN) [Phytophthora cinnamomi]|uniref:Crinkler (CRN) n=1 Tax=Phytophthora cinnamomi TaxID=4785 RepID=UPI00355988F1|nr:Crinkler (CRN) [Phytophthora cinnamomi]